MKQDGQEAEEGDGAEDEQSDYNCNCKLKCAWWEQRTQWHYRHWKQFKTAFVAYWVTEADCRGNMSVDDNPADSARSSQQAASGDTGKVVATFGQPPPHTHPRW